MTSELTAKQKANREYYAKNAERICAQKRQSSKPSGKPKAPPKPKPITVNHNWRERVRKKQNPFEVSDEDKRKLETRRRIEDRLLARELGLDGF